MGRYENLTQTRVVEMDIEAKLKFGNHGLKRRLMLP
jgi:hypothetical protein